MLPDIVQLSGTFNANHVSTLTINITKEQYEASNGCGTHQNYKSHVLLSIFYSF